MGSQQSVWGSLGLTRIAYCGWLGFCLMESGFASHRGGLSAEFKTWKFSRLSKAAQAPGLHRFIVYLQFRT